MRKMFLEYFKDMTFMKKLKENEINNLVVSSIYNNKKIDEIVVDTLRKDITDGSNDKSIDLVVIVDEPGKTKTAHLIQHTTSSSGCNAKIIACFHEMKSVVSNWKKQYENGDLNKEVYKKIKYIKESKEDIDIKYVFISDFESSKIETSTRDDVNKMEDCSLISQNKFEYYIMTRMLKDITVDEIYIKKPAMFIQEEDLDISGLRDKQKKVKFGTIKAESLVRQFKKHGKNLFADNVRYYLGRGNKINSQMLKTLNNEENKSKFTMYNNGITVVCSDIEIPSSNKTVFSLWDAQIINGAQTTNTLVSLDDSSLKDILVPIKIVISPNQSEVHEIAKFSNSQSSISQRDLFSNSNEQKILQEFFIEKGVFVEIKINEFVDEKIKQFVFVSNIKLGQNYLASFSGQPMEARNQKSKIFSEQQGGYYEKIFLGSNNEKLYMSYLIGKKVNEAIKLSGKGKTEYFEQAMIYLLYKRLHSICSEITIHSVFSVLKNISPEKIKNIFEVLIKTLIEKDKNKKGEDKTYRELSISSNLKTLLDDFNADWS